MTELRLFDDGGNVTSQEDSPKEQHSSADSFDHASMVRRSAVWATYGDAFGWISELTDKKGLERRTAGKPLSQPIEWRRRIGGRAGVTATLPMGCYSDDSQLRLATGRAIRSDGFDVEAFSKVELPVWLSYALGGGKATSAGAANLARPRVQWFNNTFRGWTDSGGNGAAMRIQPHVWAARDLDDPTTYLLDVVRNAICTHSHPDGLIGAVLHALALARALSSGGTPTPEDLLSALKIAAELPEMVMRDVEVGHYWRGAFERRAGDFADAWRRAIDDCRRAIQAAMETSKQKGADRYNAITESLKLADPAWRGNGMLTAVAAASLSWCEPRPEAALRIAVNAIGTDTDTIATMAGALLGVCAESDPPVEVMDATLIRFEAERLSAIATGEATVGYRYPDLIHWSAPKTRADALVELEDGGIYVVGLGSAKALEKPMSASMHGFQWQWVELEFGQTLLIKRRQDLVRRIVDFEKTSDERLGDEAEPVTDELLQMSQTLPSADCAALTESRTGGTQSRDQLNGADAQPDVEAMIEYLEKHNFSNEYIGRAIRRVVEKCTVGQTLRFLGVLIERLRDVPPALPRE